MKIKELNLDDIFLINRLKQFVDAQPNVDAKQTVEWGIHRKEEKYLLYAEDENENIIFYANTFVCKDIHVNDMSLYISRGPVCDKSKISLENVLVAIYKFAFEKGIKFIRVNSKIFEIDLLCFENNGLDVEILPQSKYLLLRESFKEAIVFLEDKNDEELLMGFHSKTRYNIRKSLKNSLVTLIEDSIDIDDFYNMYLNTAQKHDFIPRDKAYFEELIKQFGDKVVFCTVKYDEDILAMSINIKQGDSLFYFYGTSSSKYKNLFACYNMHWSMIKYAMENNMKYYNFGGVFADDDDVDNKDYGLLKFKSGFCENGFTEYIPDMIIKNK